MEKLFRMRSTLYNIWAVHAWDYIKKYQETMKIFTWRSITHRSSQYDGAWLISEDTKSCMENGKEFWDWWNLNKLMYQVPTTGILLGKCIRVRGKIDITKPLCHGRFMKFGGSNWCWVSFRYERLPIFCYWCRKLNHDEKDCRIWIRSNRSL